MEESHLIDGENIERKEKALHQKVRKKPDNINFIGMLVLLYIDQGRYDEGEKLA